MLAFLCTKCRNGVYIIYICLFSLIGFEAVKTVYNQKNFNLSDGDDRNNFHLSYNKQTDACLYY